MASTPVPPNDDMKLWRRQSDGAAMAYTDTMPTGGKVTGPAVVVMHGWGCTHSTVASLSAVAAGCGRRVIAVDFPGFGASPEPPLLPDGRPWGVDAYTGLLEDMLEALGVESPVLVGHSFGGRVALLFGSRSKADRLVLVDAAGIPPRHGLKWHLRVKSYKLYKRLCMALLGPEKARQRIEKAQRRRGSADYASSSPAMRAVMSRVVNEDLRPVMPKVKCPALLIWGELDTATPLSDAKQMLRLLPDSGLVSLSGADHYSFLRNPQVAAAAIRSFLGATR